MKKLIISLYTAAIIGSVQAPVAKAGANPLLGEIMWVGFNFCPRGWADANGQLLAINSNQALFSLYGTIYGGDGRTTFALPDLRGRTPVHVGQGPALSNYPQGSKGGAENVVLNTTEIPSHSHDSGTLAGTTIASIAAATSEIPAGNMAANGQRAAIYDGVPACLLYTSDAADD